MKKSLFILSSVLVSASLFFGCHKAGTSSSVASGNDSRNASQSNEVTIYTYDSFVSEWGPAPQIAAAFETKTGLKAIFVDCGDGVQLLSRAILEKDESIADIILGIDNNTAQKALDSDILAEYSPKDAEKIISNEIASQLIDSKKLTAYDYSHFALIFNTKSNFPEPTSLSDLTNPVYERKIILMDPRTSTPGLGFVAWTKAVFTESKEFTDFWNALKPNILTMASGWSAGYGLFTKDEAPLVISYTTSPAANLEYDKIDYYKALIFEEGHALQVEGAGILKNAPNRKNAEAFMDFLISEEAQNTLPLTQWMYPVNANVSLPECYEKAAAQAAKTVSVDSDTLNAAVEEVVALF